MKRILSLLLALSMIIAVSAVMSSCDMLNQYLPDNTEDVITVEDGYLVVNGVKTEYKVLVEEENNGQNGNEEENNDQPDNKEVRTTVTKEEFVEIFTMGNNYTAKMTFTYSSGLSYIYNIKRTATASYCYAEERNSAGELLQSVERYYVMQEGVEYVVYKIDNRYVGEPSVDDMIRSFITFPELDETTAAENYDMLIYDEEEKAYTYTDVSSTAMYFENGKIVKMVQYDDISLIYERSDTGTTVVEVPEFTIVDNSGSDGTTE